MTSDTKQLRLPLILTRSGRSGCRDGGAIKPKAVASRHVSSAPFSDCVNLNGLRLSKQAEALKIRMIDAEEQKSVDYPWRTTVQHESHLPFPNFLNSTESQMDEIRPKRLIWEDIVSVLRREECAIIEYDLLDASGGASTRVCT